MATGVFGTAINCMDGRTQLPIANWIKANFYTTYVDMINEPGPERFLTQGTKEQIEYLKAKVLISVNNHGSRVIALVAHDGCAGNPVTKEEHLAQVRQGMRLLSEWQLPVQIVGLWVDASGSVETVTP